MQKWCNKKTVLEKSIGQLWSSHKIFWELELLGEKFPPPCLAPPLDRTVIEGSPVVDPEGTWGGGGGGPIWMGI